MSMTPREIHEKHFHDAFRGYNHEEVDTFLDEVAEAFERLYRDNQNLLRRVADLQEQASRSPEASPAASAEMEQDDLVSESLLKRMLVMAQETADKAVQEAKQKAQMLMEKAQARAKQVEEEARTRAERTVAEAQRRAVELEESAVDSRRELQEARAGLRRFEEDYRIQFRAFIESQLEALNSLPSSPEPASSAEDSATIFDAPQTGGGARGLRSQEFADKNPPEAVGGFASVAKPEPTAPEEKKESKSAVSDDGPGGNSKNSPQSVAASATSRPITGSQVRTDSPAPVAGREQSPEKAGSSADDGDEDRLIRELFWGEE